MTRKEIADALKVAACSYFLKKGFACHLEIGVAKWGKYKADVLCVNMKAELILVEVKSCSADFNADDKKGKWLNYLPVSNKLYFLFTPKTARHLEPHFERFKSLGVGVLTLCPNSGYLKVILPAKRRPMKGSMKREIVTRLAWRNGDVSRRNARRTRIYIEE